MTWREAGARLWLLLLVFIPYLRGELVINGVNFDPPSVPIVIPGLGTFTSSASALKDAQWASGLALHILPENSFISSSDTDIH